MEPTSANFEWNKSAIQQLTTLWAEGHSTAEIGRRFGITKNAVVGKSHRLDLPARPSPIRKTGSGETRPPRRPHYPGLAEIQRASSAMQPPVPAAAEPAPPPRHRSGRTAPTQHQDSPGVSKVNRGEPAVRTPPPPPPPPAMPVRPLRTAIRGKTPCCWPIGEPGTNSFRFCEALNETGKPYCPDHCAIAYVQPPGRRAAA